MGSAQRFFFFFFFISICRAVDVVVVFHPIASVCTQHKLNDTMTVLLICLCARKAFVRFLQNLYVFSLLLLLLLFSVYFFFIIIINVVVMFLLFFSLFLARFVSFFKPFKWFSFVTIYCNPL